ncbi:MAG: hypothetical protein L0220_23810 [Acidobacteria bacterium]|nr:hypothetical protein [Acidobacteriota bacterium]
MQNEKEKIEYWTESTLLKERGWSKGRIAKLLKKPDKLVPNPHYRTASKMRLYDQSRVRAIDIVVRIVLDALDAREGRRRQATPRFDQVERIYDIWHGQLNLETGAGVEAFVYVFTGATAINGSTSRVEWRAQLSHVSVSILMN